MDYFAIGQKRQSRLLLTIVSHFYYANSILIIIPLVLIISHHIICCNLQDPGWYTVRREDSLEGLIHANDVIDLYAHN